VLDGVAIVVHAVPGLSLAGTRARRHSQAVPIGVDVKLSALALPGLDGGRGRFWRR